MKKFFLMFCLLGIGLPAFAQTVQYTIRYNLAQNRYEVYAKSNFTQLQYNWGSSQVSIVLPASLTNVALTINSNAAGGWADNSQAYDVQGADFHGVGSNGVKVDLTNGQEVLLFSFTLPGGICLNGVRLFVNGTDPASSVSGMNGGDFSNTMYSGDDAFGATNLYLQNYANTGTLCTTCSLTAPILSK